MSEMSATIAGRRGSERSDCARQLATHVWAVLIWSGGIALFLWQMYRQRFFFHDDAFISLRYAVQLATFGELTWNLGERVEGYTNFLQIMATAGLTTLGFDPVAAVRS